MKLVKLFFFATLVAMFVIPGSSRALDEVNNAADNCPPNNPQCEDLSLPLEAPEIPFTCNFRGGATFKDVVLCSVSTIVNPLILLLTSLAGLMFMWGLIKYLSKGGNKAELDKAKKYIVAGIIGLVIMLSFVGIANWIVRVIGSNLFTDAPYPSQRN